MRITSVFLLMTDEEVASYLEDNGYPAHIVRHGRLGLIARWTEFAAEVEQGYQYGLEDYRHDLDIRGVIATLGLETKAVEQADTRLRDQLVNTEVRVWESLSGEPFWDFGFPKNAGDRLLRDLRNALPQDA